MYIFTYDIYIIIYVIYDHIYILNIYKYILNKKFTISTVIINIIKTFLLKIVKY